MIDPERAFEIEMELGCEKTYTVYQAYKKAGFTRHEAFELIKIHLAATLTDTYRQERA